MASVGSGVSGRFGVCGSSVGLCVAVWTGCIPLCGRRSCGLVAMVV